MLIGTCYEKKRSHSFDVTHYEEVGDHVTILILDVSPLYNNGHTCTHAKRMQKITIDNISYGRMKML